MSLGAEGDAGIKVDRGLVLVGCAGVAYRGHIFTPEELAAFRDDIFVKIGADPNSTTQIMWLAARLPLLMASMDGDRPSIEMEYQQFSERTAAYRFTSNGGTLLVMPTPGERVANFRLHMSPSGLAAISFDNQPYNRIIAAVGKLPNEYLLPPLEPPAGLRLPSWQTKTYD